MSQLRTPRSDPGIPRRIPAPGVGEMTLAPPETDLNALPPEAALFLGIAVADVCYEQQGGLPWMLRRFATEELRDIARHIAECEFDTCWIRDCVALDAGGELPLGPSWWVTDVLPAIKAELERRARPRQSYPSNSPIARLKALDLATVAGRYTELRTASPGKSRGRCPLHQERTPSFYVYEDSQRWRCYGACATGGDVVDLIRGLAHRSEAETHA